MSFNKLNSVEHFIIHQLTGINLNAIKSGLGTEEEVTYGDTPKWKYVQVELLRSDVTEVFVERELKEALIRLNELVEVHLPPTPQRRSGASLS